MANEKLVRAGYEYAKEVYAEKGVNVDQAMEKAKKIAVSMHCWQGDDVIGCEGEGGGASGGIQTTGNYPGKARNGDELRSDFLKAISMIPGKKKLNLHASYAELYGKKGVDRDAYTVEQFKGWMDFSREHKIALDFNPTYFSHPYAEDGFTLASADEKKRSFWIEHGKRCREIGEAFGKAQGEPCVINFWMPDGYKDTPADTLTPRTRMADALDQIFAAKKIEEKYVLDAVESKLFGIGVESYTVGSGEFMLAYAISRGKLLTLDSGHFHPTEYVSDKISAVMAFLPKMLLHISRPVRWDSDHVVTLDTEFMRIFGEIIKNGLEDRVCVALDYFDASINRVAAWVIGVRNAQKAILSAYLCPEKPIREAESKFDYTGRLALQEESKTLPFAPVWDMYCLTQGVPVGDEWLGEIRAYERDVLAKRV